MKHKPKDMVHWWVGVDRRRALIAQLHEKGIQPKNPHNMKLMELEELLVKGEKTMRSINELVQEAHQNAISKGWWDEDRSFGEIIALIHSEASEALEDYRNGFMPSKTWYEKNQHVETDQIDDTWKPCGIPSEMADIVIRVFDACGRYGIDLETAITEKMAYNATRERRHGGKVI